MPIARTLTFAFGCMFPVAAMAQATPSISDFVKHPIYSTAKTRPMASTSPLPWIVRAGHPDDSLRRSDSTLSMNILPDKKSVV